jgi:phage-related tail protein
MLQIATLPIDTAKVRLQLLQKVRVQAAPGAAVAGAAAAASSEAQRLGMVSVMQLIAREEGVAALYKGFWPAIHRQIVFASLRIGLYKQVRRRRASRRAQPPR